MTLSASFSPQSVDVDIEGQTLSTSVPDSQRVPTPGPQGEPGFSPIVSVDVISGGHEVTITDEGGEHVFDVLDGADGKDGQDGKPGEDGKPGSTPEIFTAATTLSPGSSAYAHVSGTIEQPLITFGIPQGATGSPGKDGKDGEPGTTTYSDLTDKPSINGTTLSGNVTMNVSSFPNDAGYLTIATLPIWDGGVE